MDDEKACRRTDAVKTRDDAMVSITLMYVRNGCGRVPINVTSGRPSDGWMGERQHEWDNEVKGRVDAPLAGPEAIR